MAAEDKPPKVSKALLYIRGYLEKKKYDCLRKRVHFVNYQGTLEKDVGGLRNSRKLGTRNKEAVCRSEANRRWPVGAI